MYKLRVKDKVFTIPKGDIGLFAYLKAADSGINIDPKDGVGAIEYLRAIGIMVEEIIETSDVPEKPDWGNRAHRDLYDKLFYRNGGRQLTQAENEFCKTMYHLEEYACGLDG